MERMLFAVGDTCSPGSLRRYAGTAMSLGLILAGDRGLNEVLPAEAWECVACSPTAGVHGDVYSWAHSDHRHMGCFTAARACIRWMQRWEGSTCDRRFDVVLRAFDRICRDHALPHERPHRPLTPGRTGAGTAFRLLFHDEYWALASAGGSEAVRIIADDIDRAGLAISSSGEKWSPSTQMLCAAMMSGQVELVQHFMEYSVYDPDRTRCWHGLVVACARGMKPGVAALCVPKLAPHAHGDHVFELLRAFYLASNDAAAHVLAEGIARSRRDVVVAAATGAIRRENLPVFTLLYRCAADGDAATRDMLFGLAHSARSVSCMLHVIAASGEDGEMMRERVVDDWVRLHDNGARASAYYREAFCGLGVTAVEVVCHMLRGRRVGTQKLKQLIQVFLPVTSDLVRAVAVAYFAESGVCGSALYTVLREYRASGKEDALDIIGECADEVGARPEFRAAALDIANTAV